MRKHTVDIGALPLDCGDVLPRVEQRVTIAGESVADGSNVVLVLHALTGSGDPQAWWPGVVGDEGLFDTDRWCVIGVNALGSCYGSTGPSSVAPDGRAYGARFPRITVADIVRAQGRALALLRVAEVAFAIGGSLGGMQALQWALDEPGRVRHAVIIGAHDHHSAMGIAFNAVQRDAIALDPLNGLRLARKIATLTYKSEALFNRRHGRRPDREGRACFDVEGYLERQADALAGRMDGLSYAVLTHAMDEFDARGACLHAGPGPELTFVGITSDVLFRAHDVRAAAQRFAARGFDARYLELESDHGHDAFLAEPPALRTLLESLFESEARSA